MGTITVSKPWKYLLDEKFADKALSHVIMKPSSIRNGERKRSGRRVGKGLHHLAATLGLVSGSDDVAETFCAMPSPSAEDKVSENAGLGVFDPVSFLPIDHASAITYVTSCRMDNLLLYVSPQISLLGYSQETLMGVTDFRLLHVHDEDMEHFDHSFVDSCAVARPFDCKYRLAGKSGKVRWFHDVARVVCDENGKPLFLKGVMLDITDKKEMEAELEQHRYYLERNVDMRTTQLMKRVEILEACNRALCERLSISAGQAAIDKMASDPSLSGVAWGENVALFPCAGSSSS